MNTPFENNHPNQHTSKKIKKNVLIDVKMIIDTLKISNFYVLKYPKTLTDFFIKNK